MPKSRSEMFGWGGRSTCVLHRQKSTILGFTPLEEENSAERCFGRQCSLQSFCIGFFATYTAIHCSSKSEDKSTLNQQVIEDKPTIQYKPTIISKSEDQPTLNQQVVKDELIILEFLRQQKRQAR